MKRERRGAGRPRDPEIDRAILMATFRLLAVNGYAAMSVEGVATAAGVGKATIYRRFSDKRELVIAALSMLRQEAPPLPDTGEVRSDLMGAIRDVLGYFEGLDGFAIVGTLLTQARRNPEFLELFREHVIVPRRRALTKLLQNAVRRGQLREDVDLDAVVDCVAGPVFVRHLTGLPMDEAWLESVMEIVLSGTRKRAPE
jgi:AcrR family transcriptional regulator